jgi:hypothetical protein
VGDRPTGAGHQEHQRIAILAHVDVSTWSGPTVGRSV